MKIKFIQIGKLNLPIFDDWQITSNGRSYEGEAGLLDPRIVSQVSSIDEGRVRLAEKQYSEPNDLVVLVKVRGHNSLFCKYKKQSCTILAYSIPEEDGSEIQVVYVLRPGFEHLIYDIHMSIVDSEV